MKIIGKNNLLRYKILCLIILGLLIISNYVEIASDETYYSVVINTWWYIGVPTVIVSWVFLVKAVKNFNKDSFWQNIRNFIIIRCTLTMISCLFIQVFISDEARFYVNGFPIVMSYISLMLLLALKKYRMIDDVVERVPDEPVINVGYILSVFGCMGAVMTGLSSVLRMYSYENAHITLMKFGFEYLDWYNDTPLKSNVLEITFYGWVLFSLGFVMISLYAKSFNKKNIPALIMCIVILTMNIFMLQCDTVKYMKYGLETKSSWGAMFMVMGPVLCIISEVGKMVVDRRTVNKI